MAKLRLTKTELKNQKDSLKRFKRYLPTLQLKKQQLQAEIFAIEQKQVEKRKEQAKLKESFSSWVAVFGEDYPLQDYIAIETVKTSTMNIAGVEIPVFEQAVFSDIEWDLHKSPLWADAGIQALKKQVICDVEVMILQEQIDLLAHELRTTSQRVNLFEKVLIPQTNSNIKKINVQLGDERTAAVVRGKIAKTNLAKIEEAVS